MKALYLLKPVFDDPRFELLSFDSGDKPELPSLLGRSSLKADLDPTPEIEQGLPIVSLKDKWIAPRTTGKLGDYNDFPTIYPVPAFSPKAVKALHDLLDGNGELLPMRTNLGQYYLFHVTQVADIVDLDKSDIAWQHDRPNLALAINHFVLKQGVSPPSSIFIIRQLPQETYVTDEFAERVVSHRLQGMRFYKAWPVEKSIRWRRHPVDFDGVAEQEREAVALKANTVVLMLRTKVDEPSVAERKRLEKIEDRLDEMLSTDTLDEEKYLGAIEGHDEIPGVIRIYLSCPNAQRLADVLAPWRDNLKWWPTRVEMLLGDCDFREAPPEVIPKMFHDE